MNGASSFCRNAVVYVKAAAPTAVNSISVPELDYPVLFDLKNGLVVAYLVDEASSFTYVQNRHLKEAEIDLLQLHEYGVENLRQLAEEKLRVHEYESVHAVFLMEILRQV